jgi:heme-degrading monooxygenase HmoA
MSALPGNSDINLFCYGQGVIDLDAEVSSETETAERIWKTECATLMISQKGCISEKLLRARGRGEFISYSEWETEADIERYTSSAAHKQIVSHTRGVKGASAVVKLYDLVN